MNTTPLDPLSRVPLVLAAVRGRLRAFSADGASPHEATSEERRSAVEFLSELRGLGAHLHSMGNLEEMFFIVLRDPAAGGKWEGERPFLPDSGVIDWDGLVAAARDFSEIIGLASLAPDAAKELFPAVAKFLEDATREQWRQGIEAGVAIVGRPESLSIGQILRGALFIVLASPSGIRDQEKLRSLVSTELRASQEDTLDPTATAIQRASGLTKAQWQRAGRGAAPTA
jgi:hypothetical protein